MNRSGIEAIANKLAIFSERHLMIEHAMRGYANWYKNESKDMLYPPEDIEMIFESQTLSFLHWTLTYPFITTHIKLFVNQERFGYYCLITDLNGTIEDDYLGWGNPIYFPLKIDNNFMGVKGKPIRIDKIPTNMQGMIIQLSQFSQQQRLIEHAHQECAAWFSKYPDWYKRYPLAELIQYHEIHTGFTKQSLCFKHRILNPYFRTVLRIFAGRYEIGEYSFITDIEGKIDQEATEIFLYPIQNDKLMDYSWNYPL